MTIGEWLASIFTARAWTVAMVGTDVPPVTVQWNRDGATVTAWIEWPPLPTSVEFTRLELRSGELAREWKVGATRVLAGNPHIAKITYDFGTVG